MFKTALFVCGLLLGGGVGAFSVLALMDHEEVKISERELALSNRIGAFTPTCEQLSKPGTYGPLSLGQDNIVLVVEEGTFYVFGFNNSPGTPPSTTWWGSDRAEMARQVCDAK